jgi:hypothetical protein
MQLAHTPTDAARRKLLWVKWIHTLIWAGFASAIVAIPVLTAMDALQWASWLSALVFVEVAVLAVNHMRCPLTDIAARYTANRADNFDIFLPLWLARHNKSIFGSLFVAAELFLLWRRIAG